MRLRRTGPKNAWSEQLFRALRGEVTAVLRERDARKEPRLPWLTAEVRRLEADDTPAGRLRRYVCAMYALHEHLKRGGLSPREAEQLADLARSLLRAQGVVPRRSKLAHLYRDIHLVRSQLFRGDGRHWDAAWEHQLALHHGGPQRGDTAFEELLAANRLLRLGDAVNATTRLRRLTSPAATLALGQALALSGREPEGLALLADLAGDERVPKAVRLEASWQRQVVAVRDLGELGSFLKAVERGGPFYQPSYVVEAVVWTFACPSPRFIGRLPQLASIKRRGDLRFDDVKPWLQVAQMLESLHDTAIPLNGRIDRLGDGLRPLARLPTIDKELLVRAAAYRWLVRAHLFEMAELVRGEFRALALRLSDGAPSGWLAFLPARAEVELRRVAVA